MALSYEAVQGLFNRGDFEAITREGHFIAAAPEATEFHRRLVVAHAFALSGDHHRARGLLEWPTGAQEDPALRSRVQIVLGLICEAGGDMREALEHFQLSVRLAHTSGDPVPIAWAQLRLFRHLIDRSSTGALNGMLGETRRIAARAGSPQISAYLHQCVAVLEGQAGKLTEARRHCDIADALLEKAPNRWLRTGGLVTRSCLAILNCDFNEAAKQLEEARRDMVRGTARETLCDVNLAHCRILAGEFDKAFRTLRRVQLSAQTSHLALLGVHEGLARLHLAKDELGECEAALNQIDTALSADSGLGHTFHIRWSAITRARFLIKTGRAAEAASYLEAGEEHFARTGDSRLAAAIHLTIAQAYAAVGDLRLASRRLMAADRAGVAKMPELQPAYYYTCALAVAASSETLRYQLERRAKSIWKTQGIASLPLEIGGMSAPSRGTGDDVVVDQGASTSLHLLDSLAAVIDLADVPPAMGAEVLNLIRASGCNNAKLIVSSDVTASKASGDVLTIELGTYRGSCFTVACPIPSEPLKVILLAAIARTVETAVEIGCAREAERNRAALWPAEPVEEQAGALFVADEMKALLATARRVAPTTVPVLITGETGTGKEVLARTVHAYSTRAKAAFAAFNCTSTPRDMLDSQLFGHRRGAFTGALEHFPGVIRAAAGGTLFLDEIGDMPLDVQPKLLRFLEAGEVHPLGETQPVRADVRVIAATNASLDALVGDGRFREDLFYRLNIVRLHIPPLRERRVEIPSLANHYLHKYALECGKGELRLAEETIEYLVLYRWPGNVRQLANEMRRIAALCEAGAVLMPEHLSPEIAASRRTIPASERVLDPTEIVVRLDQPMSAATDHLHRAMVRYALKQCHGRMEETAAMLGLSRKGLYLKRQRFGLDVPGGAILGSV